MANQLPASAILEQQLELLSQLQELLVQEQEVLSQRKLDLLAAIPPQKTRLLLQLQQGDQTLSQHDLTSAHLQEQVILAKSRLALCKQLNEDNGRMIALAMTSIGKLQSMMCKSNHQLSATTTYNAQGSTSRMSSTGNSISV